MGDFMTLSDLKRPSVDAPPPRKALRKLVFGVAALIALAGIVVGILASLADGPSVLATYVRPSSTALGSLSVDAHTMTRRFENLGYPWISAEVSGRSIEVLTTKSVSHPQFLLRVAASEGVLQFRPVLCFADLFSGIPTHRSPVPAECSSPQYAVTSTNLAVNTTTGQGENTVPPDPALVGVQSSTPRYNDANPSQPVLLRAATAATGPKRYLLGPSRLSNRDIVSARATSVANEWLVTVTLSDPGAAQWNAVAQQQFHAFVGVDLDGVVISAPLVLPTQPTFSSFGDSIQISGNFTRQSARGLASLLNSGSLPGPLELSSLG